MYSDDHDMNEIRLQLGLLKKDNEMVVNITNKFSESIDKIQEMNSNLLRMIALHDQKHDSHNKTENELKEDIKELHSRITTVNREIHERIDEVERHISGRIDELRSDLIKHAKTDPTRLSNALAEIDKYKWMILGGALALGWLIGNVDLAMLGKLLK